MLAGTPVSPYANWSGCAATIAAAIAVTVAGDTIYIDKAHTESGAGATRTWPGTGSNPNRILVGTPDTVGGTGLTSLDAATGVTDNQSSTVVWNGSFYAYGVNITMTSAASQFLSIGRSSANVQEWENCKFRITGGSGTSHIRFGADTASTHTLITLRDCQLRFSNTAQRCRLNSRGFIYGLSHDAGSTPVGVFECPNDDNGVMWRIAGYDFSDRTATMNLLQGITGNGVIYVEFDRCRAPSGWSGSPCASALRAGAEVRATNVDDGSTNYVYFGKQLSGVIDTETTIVRTGGASDGTTPFSLKLVSAAASGWPVHPLRFECKPVWLTTAGGTQTVTIEIVTDGVTLNNDEIALGASYLGTSTAPLGAHVSTRKSMIAAAAAVPSSSVAWTTTGLASPVKQKLALTFGGLQKDGWVVPLIELYKPSTTVYVDPKPTVT